MILLNDILILSCGPPGKHVTLVRKGFKKRDDKGLRMNLPKCYFAQDKIEWLG